MAMGGGEGGGALLSELYKSAQKLLIRTKDGLSKLESIEFSTGASSSSSSSSSSSMAVEPLDLSTALRRDLGQIQSFCSEMDRLWRSIPSPSQRGLWKRKVEQVAEEADSLRRSLDRHVLRHQSRIQEAKDRKNLLERRNGDSAHVLRIFDEEAQAMESAQNSSRMLEEAYATGVAVLSKYSEQRDRIKRAQRKALDVLNTVGLSNSLLKLIERRHRTDKWIAYGGMISVTVIVYMFWRWIN
ncbi:membrin 12 [Wolffia australiana]